MREAERRTESEYGVSLAVLMDNAGYGLFRSAIDFFPEGSIGIFCGNGNNGGDGYVCASCLMKKGREVFVWGVEPEKHPEGSLVKNAHDRFVSAGGLVHPVTYDLKKEDIKCGSIIDALLGTGLSRTVSGIYSHAIRIINAVPSPVLSCDIPSGVDADTGRIMGVAVKADKTLMMGLAKMACRRFPGSECFGKLELCDIGLPRELTL